jgi:hypothetical protein
LPFIILKLGGATLPLILPVVGEELDKGWVLITTGWLSEKFLVLPLKVAIKLKFK